MAPGRPHQPAGVPVGDQQSNRGPEQRPSTVVAAVHYSPQKTAEAGRLQGCAQLLSQDRVLERGRDRTGQIRPVSQCVGDAGGQVSPDVTRLDQEQHRTPDVVSVQRGPQQVQCPQLDLAVVALDRQRGQEVAHLVKVDEVA